MAADAFYITDGDQLKLSGGMIMVTEAPETEPETEPTTEATTQQTEAVA